MTTLDPSEMAWHTWIDYPKWTKLVTAYHETGGKKTFSSLTMWLGHQTGQFLARKSRVFSLKYTSRGQRRVAQ